jgi:hypothetical protein
MTDIGEKEGTPEAELVKTLKLVVSTGYLKPKLTSHNYEPIANRMKSAMNNITR